MGEGRAVGRGRLRRRGIRRRIFIVYLTRVVSSYVALKYSNDLGAIQ